MMIMVSSTCLACVCSLLVPRYHSHEPISKPKIEIISDPAYPGQWRVKGPYIEQVAKMTHWEYPEAVERFGRQLHALGIADELTARGAMDGDLGELKSNVFKYLMLHVYDLFFANLFFESFFVL